MALVGYAMSHAAFPGVIIAYMVGLPLAVGAFVAGLVCAMTIGFLKNNSRIKHDTLMGIVLRLASDVCQSTVSVPFAAYLFGDMLGIGADDLIEAAAISASTVLFVTVKWRCKPKPPALMCAYLHYGLLCFLALTIVATLRRSGLSCLVRLVIDCSMGHSFSYHQEILVDDAGFRGHRHRRRLLGVYVSFFLDSSPWTTIVLFFTLMFVAVFLIKEVQSHCVRYAT